MYIYTEREINDLKTELYVTKAKLSHIERQLTKANAQLLDAQMWVRTYQSAYEQYLCKCSQLIKANEALRRTNRDLEMGLKAIKSTINAFKRKEMI